MGGKGGIIQGQKCRIGNLIIMMKVSQTRVDKTFKLGICRVITEIEFSKWLLSKKTESIFFQLRKSGWFVNKIFFEHKSVSTVSSNNFPK